MTCWRELISCAMERHGDAWGNVEFNTMDDSAMDRQFNDDYGATQGCAFTVWTRDYVYFPLCYDGAEWAGSVRRNPGAFATEHQGGG